MSRFWFVPLSVLAFVILPFLIWGEVIEDLVIPGDNKGFGLENRMYFWAICIGLLVADIFLPIPTTAVIAALGITYGPWLGAGWAIVGTVLAAVIGYAIGRFLGRPIALWMAGDSMAGGERIFARYGGWIVTASRWLPVLPEVVSVVAGVSQMRFIPFVLAVLCGVIPFCFLFALVGHLGAEQPVWTLIISALAPLMLWWLANFFGLIRKFDLDPKD